MTISPPFGIISTMMQRVIVWKGPVTDRNGSIFHVHGYSLDEAGLHIRAVHPLDAAMSLPVQTVPLDSFDQMYVQDISRVGDVYVPASWVERSYFRTPACNCRPWDGIHAVDCPSHGE